MPSGQWLCHKCLYRPSVSANSHDVSLFDNVMFAAFVNIVFAVSLVYTFGKNEILALNSSVKLMVVLLQFPSLFTVGFGRFYGQKNAVSVLVS